MASRPDDSPRRAAYEILLRVDEGAFADLVLDSTLNRSKLDSRDRGLVTELVYGVLRLRMRLDFALVQFTDRPLQRIQADVVRVLRLGAYQLLELDRIPAHAAVNSSVELIRELGQDKAAGFVNGILRSMERGKADIDWPQPENIRRYLQHVCSMPVWLSKEVMRLLPNAEAQALGEALAGSAPFTLRANTLKVNRDQLLDALEAAGHQARPCQYAPEGIIIEKRGDGRLPGNVEGWYQVQDEASMLISHLLDAQPGQRILDSCAAPGGKTTHLAALTNNQSEIVALDKHKQRVELIEQGAKRLGCTEVYPHQWDLTERPDESEAQSYDRVLLDAPCSGLGVLRRNPEIRWNKTAVNIRELAELQQEILFNVAALVKPGGKLLYSVCSFSILETDEAVKDFLAAHTDFVLEDLREHAAPEWDELFTDQGTLRTYPHQHDGMDAFFAARLRRLN